MRSCVTSPLNTESPWTRFLMSRICNAHGCCFFYAASRPNYVLTVWHPDTTREFAARHEEGVRRCLNRLLGVVLPEAAWNLATIPLNLGGLTLRNAIKGRLAAFFASWADGLEMNSERHSSVADLILNDLTQDRPSLVCTGPGTIV